MVSTLFRLAHRLGLAGIALAVTAAFGWARAEDILPTPYDLYETPRLSDAALATLPLGPWKVLHQERLDGTTWILLALPDGATPTDVAGARPRYLGRVRAGEQVILTAPPGPGEERLRSGRSVTLSPSGAGVLVTSESGAGLAAKSHNAWRPADRPLPAPRPRREAPSPSFQAILDRGARVRSDTPGLRTAQDVRDVVDAVHLDSLQVYVRKLSETASGARDSRWWDPGSAGDVSSIIDKSTYVRNKLEAAFGPGSVTLHGFDALNSHGEVVRVYNIVARKPSAVAGAGALLLTAHLDAIGVRSDPQELWDLGYSRGRGCDSTATGTDPDCAWNSALDPAPGADDNATGIAAMLEAARILGPKSFDFDLILVAFTAEEIGLVGSAAYADSLARAGGQEIYGVLNMDMVGYNALTNEVDIVTDGSSEWLADWMVDTGQQFVTQLGIEKKEEPFGRSDHASFWGRGIDAILLTEDIRLQYPRYHTFQDTWESTFPASGRPNPELQFQQATQLTVASIARFALQYDTPDLALPAGELDAEPVVGRDFIAGQSIRLTAGVHNYGASVLNFAGVTTDSLTARVTFHRGDPAHGGVQLGQVTKTAFFGGGAIVPFTILWDTTQEAAGFHEVFATVEGLDAGYEQLEVSAANNRTSQTLFLQAPASEAPRVLNAYVFPNPVRGTQDDVRIHYELTHSTSVTLDVFDLQGTAVGRFAASASLVAEGNRAGPNTIQGTSFVWTSTPLESGIYLYVIRTAGASSGTRGKFAIIR